MQLLSASEVQVTDAGRLFSYARWRAALLALLVIASAIVCVLIGRGQPAGITRCLSYSVAAILLFGLMLSGRFVTARFLQGDDLVEAKSFIDALREAGTDVRNIHR